MASSIILFGILIGFIGYCWNYGFCPPRTAHKVISQISKTELSSNSEVLLFHEGKRNFFMDDEFIVALVKVGNNSFTKALYSTGNFHPLTDSITTLLPIPMDIRNKYFSQKGIIGKYELNKQLGSTSLLLFDESRGYYFVLIEHL
jgi:hypothetical protein